MPKRAPRTNRRSTVLALLALAGVVAVLAWWHAAGGRRGTSTRAPAAALTSPPGAAVVADQPSLLQFVQTFPREPASTAPADPFGPHRFMKATPAETIAALATSPDRASTDAQLALVMAYEACSRAIDLSDADIEGDAAQQLVDARSASLEDVTKEAAQKKLVRDGCMRNRSDGLLFWRVNLESLAQKGSVAARDEYIRAFLVDKRNAATDVESLRERELIRGYLWERMATVDCGPGTLVPMVMIQLGPSTNYIAASLMSRAANVYADVDPAAARSHLQEIADAKRLEVPADQLDDADQTIAYLLQNSCH